MTQGRLAGWLDWRRGKRPADLAEFESLARSLLSGKGEASGAALASRLLDAYAALPVAAHGSFFELLLERFGPDMETLKAALAGVHKRPDAEAMTRLHAAAEPRRQELVRRLVNKVLHDPVRTLRQSDALHGPTAQYLHALEMLFDLKEDGPA